MNAYKYGGLATLFALGAAGTSALALHYGDLKFAFIAFVPMFVSGWCAGKASWS